MQHNRTTLAGKRILVTEDEYFIAIDVKNLLEAEGAHVIGPVSSTDSALATLATAELDAAILDINLQGDQDVYPVAAALRARAIPFVFASGYDRLQIRPDFADIPLLPKPLDIRNLAPALFDPAPQPIAP